MNDWLVDHTVQRLRSYSYLTIGFVNIPHNPSERMRGAYHG